MKSDQSSLFGAPASCGLAPGHQRRRPNLRGSRSPSRLPAEEAEGDKEPEDPPGGDERQLSPLEAGAGRIRIPSGEEGLEEMPDREEVRHAEDALRDLTVGYENSGYEIQRQHDGVAHGRRR